MALATACLAGERVALCAADNPSLIDFSKRLDLGGVGSTEELRGYLRAYPGRTADVMKTLDYFDLLNHLPALKCPSFWSASDNDPICPLPTVQGGFARAPGKRKHLHVYKGMGHDIHPAQLPLKIAWVREHFF